MAGRSRKTRTVTLPSGERVRASSVQLEEDGSVRMALLQEPQTITTPLGRAVVRSVLYYDGHVCELWLDEPQRLMTPQGRLLLRGEVLFDGPAHGRLYSFYLAEPAVLDTPIGRRQFPADYVSLLEDGLAEAANLEDPVAVDTPLGRLEAVGQAYFQDSPGTLQSLELASPTTVDTPAGRLEVVAVEWSFSDRLSCVTLASPQRIHTSVGPLHAAGRLLFWDDGTIQCLELAAPEPIDTPWGSRRVTLVRFNRQGEPDSCLLADGEQVQTSLGALDPHELGFGNEAPRWIRFRGARTVLVDGHSFEVTELALHPGGRLHAMLLGRATTFEGVRYAKGNRLLWGLDGAFQGRAPWDDYNRR